MLTPRDKLIVAHIEQYGFITNRQALEIFMDKNTTKCKKVVRRRLKAIMQSGIRITKEDEPLLLKTDKVTDENIFYYGKPPVYRDVQIMDFYARLVYMGVNINYFQKRVKWFEGIHTSDAVLMCDLKGTKINICLDVCYTSCRHINGYEELYENKEVQKLFKGIFPKIVLVGNTGLRANTFLEVINIKEDLSNIDLIFK